MQKHETSWKPMLQVVKIPSYCKNISRKCLRCLQTYLDNFPDIALLDLLVGSAASHCHAYLDVISNVDRVLIVTQEITSLLIRCAFCCQHLNKN